MSLAVLEIDLKLLPSFNPNTNSDCWKLAYVTTTVLYPNS